MKARKRPNHVWNFPSEERLEFTSAQYRLAKRSKKPLATIDIKIPCQGGMHIIRANFPGTLHMRHHKSKRDEILMQKLGGPKPECLIFLEKFKHSPQEACRGRYYAMKLLKAMEDWKSMRNNHKVSYGMDKLSLSLHERLLERLTQITLRLEERINNQFTKRPKEEWVTPWERRPSKPKAVPFEYVKPVLKFQFVDLKNKPKPKGGKNETEC